MSRSTGYVFGLMAGVAAFAAPANAQDAAAAATAAEDAAPAPQDIIVTARRREERLQDVPVAVTAVSGDALERRGVVSIQDMSRVAPSLTITQSPGSGRNLFAMTIRGQRQADNLPSLDPSVGVYVGDVLFKRLYGLNDLLFDLNTVEVLKGPQGTLFGLNVTGGNVIFRPNLPTDTFAGALEVGIGNYDARTIQGFLNVPLAEGVDFRIAGKYRKRDGYIRNVLSGQRDQDENGGGVRASLRLQPGDRLESTFVANYARRSVNGTGHHFDTIRPGSTVANMYGAAGQEALAYSRGLGFYEVAHDVDGYARTKPAWDVANTTQYTISDSLSIKNIIGYREYKATQFDDVDGGPLGILAYGSSQDGDQFSNELQLAGDHGDLSWIAGAYYLKERVTAQSFNTNTLSPMLDGVQTPYTTDDESRNTSKSLFASGTYKLDDLVHGLAVTLGGRYSWDDRRSRWGTVYSIGLPNERCGFTPATDPGLLDFDFDPAACRVNAKTSFKKFTYTASVDYHLASDKLIYFVHRKGYRAGGFSTRGLRSFTFPAFNPEIVYDFEVGAKFDWRFDNGMFVRTNLAAYTQKYNDLQRNSPLVDPATNLVTSVVRNAGRARIQGLEFEGLFAPSRWFELSGHVSYTKPKYLEFDVAVAPTPANPNPPPRDVRDTASFGGVPRWQMGSTARVTLPTPESFAATSLELTWYHQSSFISQDRLDYQPEGTVPGYSVWNARAEFDRVAGTPVRVAVFVTNLFDKKYAFNRNALASELGFADYTAAPPRMYGVTLRYSFGE